MTTTDLDPVALGVFLAFFALVTVMGFVAARWRRPETLAHLDEWLGRDIKLFAAADEPLEAEQSSRNDERRKPHHDQPSAPGRGRGNRKLDLRLRR